LRGGFDLFQRHGLVFRVVEFRTPVAEAVKFIERGRGGQMTQVLPCDFLLADEFGLGAFEFLAAVRPSARRSPASLRISCSTCAAFDGSVPA